MTTRRIARARFVSSTPARGLGRELAAGSQVVAELRRLGGLQKHLFTEGHGVGSKDYAKILVAITDAIERIADGGQAEAR